MSYSVHVTIKKGDSVAYESTKTAEEMKQSGYQQQKLQTDNEPLPPLKENDMFYLAAAVEKMKEDVGAFLSSEIEKMDGNPPSKKAHTNEEDEEVC